MNQSAFRMLDQEIDMKALVKNLAPESEAREEQDVVWEWEKLFAEVTTNLKSSKDSNSAAVSRQTPQERIV